jgi:phage protein D
MVRQPRAMISVGGVNVAPIDCSVSASTHKRGDTFSAKLALDAPGGLDEVFWADAAPVHVVVQATNDQRSGGWVTLFTGDVDTATIDFAGRTVAISGRDKTAKLLETKTTEKWQNRTTPEIVSDIAGRVGLTADVTVADADKVGLRYKDDHNRISDQDVLYNVLTRLAQREGCTVFVRGDRIVFKPIDQLGGGQYTINYVRPTPASYAAGTFTKLTATRNLAAAKNVKVNVKSWQQKQEKVIESEYQSNGPGGDLEYTYRAPNLTKQQADKIAKGRHDEVVGRERSLSIEAPGDVSLDPEMGVTLTGTGTSFDQDYAIGSIEHRFSQSEGYRMSVSTQNKDKKRKGRKSK